MTLPTPNFVATAIVAVDEPSAAVRLAAARSAADLAVSKPVILRAAASLNGTAVSAPAPALAEKIGVAAGLAAATGAVARLADALAPTVDAVSGDGLVEVRAAASDGARAARVATALGEALVMEEEGAVATAVRRRDASATTRLDALREAARAAHAHLAELGMTDSDPADALAAAVSATRSAEARVTAVHAVIAAGTPPLGAGSELPTGVAALQQTYWDLKKQLDKASESLGERHTTVIALRDGVARAAASLTAEWQRVEHAAASEAGVARSREAALRKTVAVATPAKRAAAEEARGAVRLADAALARAAPAPAMAGFASPLFRLVAQAAVPATASGLEAGPRALIVAGAGTLAFALALLAVSRRRNGVLAGDRAPATDRARATPAAAEPANAKPVAAPTKTARAAPDVRRARDPVAAEAASSRARRATIEPAQTDRIRAASEDRRRDEEFDIGWFGFEPDDHADERIAAMPFESESYAAALHPDAESPRPGRTPAMDSGLHDALRAIAADLGGLRSDPGSAVTVVVASNVAGADTGAVALALGDAAAELGYRVLVIEDHRVQPMLAEVAAPDGDPILVDAFGALRVALPVEHRRGLLVAPAFRDGARIAAALARNTQTELVDDLGNAFDALVIDGGRAADSAAAGWIGDAFIRVGRFASRKDDAFFLEALHAPPEALLGTVAAGRFVARESDPEPREALTSQRPRPALRAISGSLDMVPPRRTVPMPDLRMPPRRRMPSR